MPEIGVAASASCLFQNWGVHHAGCDNCEPRFIFGGHTDGRLRNCRYEQLLRANSTYGWRDEPSRAASDEVNTSWVWPARQMRGAWFGLPRTKPCTLSSVRPGLMKIAERRHLMWSSGGGGCWSLGKNWQATITRNGPFLWSLQRGVVHFCLRVFSKSLGRSLTFLKFSMRPSRGQDVSSVKCLATSVGVPTVEIKTLPYRLPDGKPGRPYPLLVEEPAAILLG